MKRVPVLLVVLATLGACQDSRESGVVIDLRALHRHAAQVGLSVDHINLVVSAPDLDPLVFAIDPATITFAIDVPAGAERSFEVTAYVAGASGEVPAYWGVIVVDLAPRTTLDLVIPIFPSGLVKGQVQTSDTTPLPPDLVVSFNVVQAPGERPPGLDTPVAAGNFKRPLPVGSYRLAAGFSVSAITYAAPPNFNLNITQAAVTDLGVIVLAPPGQMPPALPPEGAPVGGIQSSPGLAPAAASTMTSAGYTLHIGALAPISSTSMQSAGFRLRPAAEPMRRVP